MAESFITGLSTAPLPRIIIAGLSRDMPGNTYLKHTLSHFEINFITSGRGICELNGRPFFNEPGHAYSYMAGDVYAGRGDPTKGLYVCRWVKFSWPEPGKDKRTGAEPFKLARDTELNPQAQREFQALFDAMLELHDGGLPGWQIGASGYLQALISLLIRENSRIAAGRTDSAALDRRLARACEFMEQNSARRMKVAEIARAARLAADYFSRLFRQRLGVSPLQYLIRLRIQEGRRLLVRDPGLTIREVSLRVGFDDPKHFSRSFSKRFNMTPDQFRRQLASPRGKLAIE
jgi:AraC-like DNA-binding protein